MSFERFDKICEKMINGEPVNNKEIFDERQERVRTKILINALVCFGALASANTMFMESGLRWSESYFMPIAVFMAACYLGYVLSAARKGALFGIKGTATATRNACVLLAEGVVLMFVNFDKEERFTVVKDGALSDFFLMVVFFALVIASGAITLVLAHKYNKSKENEKEE